MRGIGARLLACLGLGASFAPSFERSTQTHAPHLIIAESEKKGDRIEVMAAVLVLVRRRPASPVHAPVWWIIKSNPLELGIDQFDRLIQSLRSFQSQFQSIDRSPSSANHTTTARTAHNTTAPYTSSTIDLDQQ